MSDRAFLTRILLACSRGRARLFRNNVGLGWVGKSTRFTVATTILAQPGDVLIRKARPLHAGLAEGSGDLIGWVTRDIRPEHVGQRWAVFASLEGKEGAGRLEPAQRAWLAAVVAAGGLAAEVRSVEDAERALQD